MKRIAAMMLTAAMALSLASPASAYNNPFVSPRGSCDSIDGVTVFVSVFVNDPSHSWDFDDSDDFRSYSNLYYRLKTACEWLIAQARRYGAQPTMIWDWYNEPYLYYVYKSERVLVKQTYQSYFYSDIRSFVTDNVDLQKIQNYYKADNLIVLVFYNQDTNSQTQRLTWSWDYEDNANASYALELILFEDENQGYPAGAANFAHEIMHCFGAMDLYMSADGMPQAYVDHLKAINSRDIMYTIDYNTPDTINEVFSDLDAYYLGLLNRCSDQEYYGLRKSPHLK